MAHGPVLCRNARIYYFYPFVTSPWASEGTLRRRLGLGQSPALRTLTQQIPVLLPKALSDAVEPRGQRFGGKIGSTVSLEPRAREGQPALEPAAYLPLVHAWWGDTSTMRPQGHHPAGEPKAIRFAVKVSADSRELDAQLFYECDIHDSGAACAVLRLDVEAPLGLESLISLTNLGQRRGLKLLTSKAPRPTSLASVLTDLTLAFLQGLRQHMGSLGYTPLEREGEDFRWVDRELYNRTEPGGAAGSSAGACHLMPSILTVLSTLEGYDAWREHRRTSRNPLAVDLALVPLLFRSHVPESLDKAFAERSVTNEHGQLYNMCATLDFFVHFHLRSCLAISRYKSGTVRDGKADQLALVSEAWLKETLKLLRMRWFQLVVCGLELDETLAAVSLSLLRRGLGRDLSLSLKEIKEEHAFRTDFRAAMLRTRAVVLRAFEDPVTYRVGSGSLVELYEEAARKLNLRELESTVARKLDSLGSLYRDIIDHWRLRETELLMDEWERLQKYRREK